MKKFISLLMIILGGIMCLWGGYYAFTGIPNAAIPLTNDFRASTMVVGLVGVGVFTIGLIGYRE